jgi:hypothetical protein
LGSFLFAVNFIDCKMIMESPDNMHDFSFPLIETEQSHSEVEEAHNHEISTVPSSIHSTNKSEMAPKAQETDNEALSSLLMLSKSNTDPHAKQTANEVKATKYYID